jgi:hypothetical protein
MRRSIWMVIFLMPAFCLGQTTEYSWDNLKQLQAGQKIEVVDMNLKSLKGRLVGVSDTAISIRTDKEEAAVERANVMRVSARGGKRGRNALIGLAVGAAAGAAIGGAQGRKTLSLSKGEEVGLDILAFAGIGAGIGSAFPGSRTIYRAERRKDDRTP